MQLNELQNVIIIKQQGIAGEDLIQTPSVCCLSQVFLVNYSSKLFMICRVTILTHLMPQVRYPVQILLFKTSDCRLNQVFRTKETILHLSIVLKKKRKKGRKKGPLVYVTAFYRNNIAVDNYIVAPTHQVYMQMCTMYQICVMCV